MIYTTTMVNYTMVICKYMHVYTLTNLEMASVIKTLKHDIKCSATCELFVTQSFLKL